MDEMNLHVCVAPSAIACFNFLETENDVIAKKKTVIIAPIRISAKNGIIIAWQCSHSLKCKDSTCFYARIVKKEQESFDYIPSTS